MNKKFFYALITVVTILVIVLIKIYFYNLDKKWYKKIDYNSYVLIVPVIIVLLVLVIHYQMCQCYEQCAKYYDNGHKDYHK